jgi:hypothetical protein
MWNFFRIFYFQNYRDLQYKERFSRDFFSTVIKIGSTEKYFVEVSYAEYRVNSDGDIDTVLYA